MATAFAGEWVVHQLAYLIEYGSRFNAVMATTPHRYYMTQAGVLFAVTALSLLSLAAHVLRLDARKRRRLLQILPTRLHRFIPATRVRVRLSVVGQTALGLACFQIAIYLVQENLEALAEAGGLPGLAVLIPPEHWPVLPLHLLIAVALSLIFLTVASLLQQSRHTIEAVERLVRLFIAGSAAPARLIPLTEHVPSRRPLVGSHPLRAPPLSA